MKDERGASPLAGSHAGVTQRQTEARNAAGPLDTLSALGVLQVMNAEDRRASEAVGEALPQLASVVEAAVDSISGGGRLIYAGAGSSGRLAVQDAIECVPTFGIALGTVLWTLAGGEGALVEAMEGVEDDTVAGRDKVVELGAGEGDLLVGISASGGTPYTLAALREARERGALAACVVNVQGSEMARVADYPLELLTGPEVLAGSTRLKAGTAQKMALNMISTAAMTGLGYVYENLMVGVEARNAKLRERAGRIVREITGCGEPESTDALERAGHDVRVAALLVDGIESAGAARRLFEESRGSLRRARDSAPSARLENEERA